MSYTSIDESSLGQPVALFEFYAEGQFYRYANCQVDIEIPDYATFSADNLTRSRFTRGIEIERAGIEITANLDLGLMEVFANGIPETAIEVYVYRTYLNDPSQEIYPVWSGVISSRALKDKSAVFKCEPPEVYLKTPGLRRRFQTTCPYAVYGPGCELSPASFGQNVTITNISSDSLTLTLSASLNVGHVGGYLYDNTTGLARYRHIASVSGGKPSLIVPAYWAEVDMGITVYPGCDKTTGTCDGTFDNLLNYGGFPAMPKTNIFNTRVY